MSDKRKRSRADLVRIRHNQQSQKRITQASTLATVTRRPLPPITSRETGNYTTQPKAKSQNLRRRFQVAISAPGIEVRLPTISFTRADVKWRLLSFFLSLLLGSGLYLAWTLPAFSVTGAQIRGNQRLAANDISAVLDTTGQSIFTLMPSLLESRLLMNYPELLSAKVSLGLPNVVNVDVVERTPVILWQQSGGYTWIDDTGVAFRPRGNADHLITLTGLAAPPRGTALADDPLSPTPFLSSEMVKAIKTLAPSIPQKTTLVYQPPYGLGWSDSRGWQAFFGSDAKHMALNLDVYQSLVGSLAKQGIKPVFISVQYANAPYYRISQ